MYKSERYINKISVEKSHYSKSYSLVCIRINFYLKLVLDRLNLRTHFNMNKVSILSAILVALYCANYVSAVTAQASCDCTCNIPTKRNGFRPSFINTIALEDGVCDINKCLTICKKAYPLCESGKAVMKAACKVA